MGRCGYLHHGYEQLKKAGRKADPDAFDRTWKKLGSNSFYFPLVTRNCQLFIPKVVTNLAP